MHHHDAYVKRKNYAWHSVLQRCRPTPKKSNSSHSRVESLDERIPILISDRGALTGSLKSCRPYCGHRGAKRRLGSRGIPLQLFEAGGSFQLESTAFLPEIRGGEAFDLPQLLNTGHSGTWTTVHVSLHQKWEWEEWDGKLRFRGRVHLLLGLDCRSRGAPTEAPGTSVSSTIRRFSSTMRNRRFDSLPFT